MRPWCHRNVTSRPAVSMTRWRREPSYSNEIAFGLTGCRRTVPHLQRLLGYLDDELTALEEAVGV